MSSELKIKAVGSDACHAQKQNDGDNCYQDVGNNQAVAQPPEEMIADPRQQPNGKIDYGDKAEKKEQPREWKPYTRKSKKTKNHVENKYPQCDAVERRSSPEENQKSA